MTSDVVVTCGIVFIARVADVSLGTLRTVVVTRGKRFAAWWLGFFEILIWIWAVSKVVPSVSETPIYGLFYALGFATGNFVGMTIERRISPGDRAVLLFTRRASRIAREFRHLHHAVTEWQGKGTEGPITLIFIKIPRKQVRPLVATAKSIDPGCFFVVENVELIDGFQPSLMPKTGWRIQSRKAK